MSCTSNVSFCVLRGSNLEAKHSYDTCRSFYTLGRRHSNELRQWFGLGVLVAGMLGVSAVVILIRELWRAIHWADQVMSVCCTRLGLTPYQTIITELFTLALSAHGPRATLEAGIFRHPW